jgi:hypothetical protein
MSRAVAPWLAQLDVSVERVELLLEDAGACGRAGERTRDLGGCGVASWPNARELRLHLVGARLFDEDFENGEIVHSVLMVVMAFLPHSTGIEVANCVRDLLAHVRPTNEGCEHQVVQAKHWSALKREAAPTHDAKDERRRLFHQRRRMRSTKLCRAGKPQCLGRR